MNPPQIDPTAQIALGNALAANGQLAEAEAAYRLALPHAPANAKLLNNLGNVLVAQRKLTEGIAIYRQAIIADPALAICHANLGNTLSEMGQIDEAIISLTRAIQLKPDFPIACNNLGNILKDQGKIEQGIELMRACVALDPSSMLMHSNLVYAILFHPDYDARKQLQEARVWAERHETPRIIHRQAHTNAPSPNRKLRIGYVSPDFREHVVGRNVLPIIQRHDRAQFQVQCFMTTTTADVMTQHFRAAADRWHDVANFGEAELAELIRSEHIDILVDLSLHMVENRLAVFARRPAPVQITWAGYPGTTGLTAMDYRLTDPYLDPPGHGDEFYSEKSVRLPHSFWCYRPVDGVPHVNESPAIANGFVTFGCLNHFAKVSRAALDLWALVLSAIANSKLVILTPLGNVMDEIRGRFSAKGIASDRLVFVQHATPSQYMRFYHQIDICLDPLPYTGHSTTLDALWMGVPVVTIKGRTVAGRGSVSPLSNLQLTYLIAETPEQYVQIATKLAKDVDRLKTLRSQLRQRMRASPICDEAGFTADLENAYRKMWQAWANR